ncbi:MAG: type II secretion system F family protein [Anaerolineae bacterium]
MGVALVISIVGAMAVVSLFVGVYMAAERSDDISARLDAYATAARRREEARSGRKRGLARLLDRIDRLLTGQAIVQKYGLYLAQANVQMTVPEFAVVVLSSSVVGGALGWLVSRQVISAVAGAILGLAPPILVVVRKRHKRLKAFRDQLVDVLSLVVGSLRGGHALMTALDLVAKELNPPSSEEFGRVLREIGLGLSQAEALGNLVTRMESDELQLVVTAINISHEVGGNLSLVLEKIAETIRERIRLQGEIRVLTTQQRLTTYLLAALPFVLSLVLAIMNPSWIMRLFAPGWIRIVPVAALSMEIAGFLIAQSLTKIEV